MSEAIKVSIVALKIAPLSPQRPILVIKVLFMHFVQGIVLDCQLQWELCGSVPILLAKYLAWQSVCRHNKYNSHSQITGCKKNIAVWIICQEIKDAL